MDKKELSKAIWDYGVANGFEEMAGICARSLIGFAHKKGESELEFTCDQGRVNVVPESISESIKH